MIRRLSNIPNTDTRLCFEAVFLRCLEKVQIHILECYRGLKNPILCRRRGTDGKTDMTGTIGILNKATRPRKKWDEEEKERR